MRVLLVTEGSYPIHFGGLSNWCDMLLRDLPEIDFSVLAIVGTPHSVLGYSLPSNVSKFAQVPLWGVREVLETRRDLSVYQIVRRKLRTSEARVKAELIPSFESFLRGLFQDDDAGSLGPPLAQLTRFFVDYDFDTAIRSRACWECFADTVRQCFPSAAARCGYPSASYTLNDISDSMSMLHHWLMPLASPLPSADVVHAVSAGLCSLVGVASKLAHGTAFLLSEHGVYLRERYLSEAATPSSLFAKLFRLRFNRRLTELSYATADQIAPGSDYNQSWELALGAPQDRLRTVYNGVDPSQFNPASKADSGSLVVVWLGRITPIKDLVTLLQAAAIVRATRPDVEFRLYGSASADDEEYYQQCLSIRSSLGIEDAVVFGGPVVSAEAAFNEGDLVVLSSISEGFPFSLLEALLCAKPVVATAVGGVPEAIEGCGIAVEPRNPQAMADGILALLNDPERRIALGKAARARASEQFTLQKCNVAYREMYHQLAKVSLDRSVDMR